MFQRAAGKLGYSLTPSGLQRYTLLEARTRGISYHDMGNLTPRTERSD